MPYEIQWFRGNLFLCKLPRLHNFDEAKAKAKTGFKEYNATETRILDNEGKVVWSTNHSVS